MVRAGAEITRRTAQREAHCTAVRRSPGRRHSSTAALLLAGGPEEKENTVQINNCLLALVENFTRTSCCKTIGRFTTSILLASTPAVVLSVSLHRFVASRKIAFKFHSFANPFTGGDELLPIDVSAGD